MVYTNIVIAGTHSGCGKTTVAAGIMAALVKKGKNVQGYKIGPDYIDPMFHLVATRNPSMNLDTWMCSKSAVKKIFYSAVKEINVIEGVMGLFDGVDATSDVGSTAHVAKLLKIPVILVVDASAMGRSVSALVRGFTNFDKDLNVAGIIFNSVGSEGHFELLKKSVKGVNILGYLPSDPLLKLPERHLGLVPTQELVDMNSWVDRVSTMIEQRVDIEEILEIANSAEAEAFPLAETTTPCVKIAVARDPAFNFYYQSNLELLKNHGAELVEFSPLSDSRVPEASAIIFGGGFPEMFAEKLSQNQQMRKSIVSLAWSGIPIYAECGGLMYLSREIIGSDGTSFPMVGLLPGQVKMENRLQNFGYCFAEALQDTFILRRGERFRGHEFHYSSWKGSSTTSVFKVGRRNLHRQEGFSKDNIHASYVHLNWFSARQIPKRLVAAAKKYQSIALNKKKEVVSMNG